MALIGWAEDLSAQQPPKLKQLHICDLCLYTRGVKRELTGEAGSDRLELGQPNIFRGLFEDD